MAILGAGRVGHALGHGLRELDWEIGVIVSRGEAAARRSARFIGAGKPHGALTRHVSGSRVMVMATPDDAAAGACELAKMVGEEGCAK